MKRLGLWMTCLACVAACGPTGPVDVCEALTPGAQRSAVVGTYDVNGEFTVYGSETPIVLGFQGGYMVTPVIRVPAEAADAPNPCFNVRIDNDLNPPGSAPNLEFSMIAEARDGMYTLEGITNFLGNLRGDLIGRTLTMEIDVITEDFSIDETVQVMLTPDS